MVHTTLYTTTQYGPLFCRYSIEGITPGWYDVELNPIPDGYEATGWNQGAEKMGDGTMAHIHCGSPDIVNFGIAPIPTATPTPTPTPAWFQAKGGDIYGKEIRSSVPTVQYLSAKLDDYSGVVVSGGGINVSLGGVSETSPDWEKENEEIVGFSRETKYGYDYFYQKFGPPPIDNFDGSKPALSGVYYDNPGTWTSITAPWQVTAGESIVVFIDGELRIENEIHVDPGGFLAFIVREDLKIGPTVGTDPVGAEPDKVTLEGVFIVDGTIDTGTSGLGADLRLVAQGIFVADADLNGDGGFTFQRDLGETLNETLAAEFFEYRPDFLFNAPKELLREGLSWEEVVP